MLFTAPHFGALTDGGHSRTWSQHFFSESRSSHDQRLWFYASCLISICIYALQCQICYKLGHTATECWHRANLAYVPAPRLALLATNSPPPTTWVLDSDASSHMTVDLQQLSLTEPYLGFNEVHVGNETTIPIQHIGQGILPTPHSNLQLSTLHHVPHLSHNLLSISHLTHDNHCYIFLDEFGFSIKDKATHKTLLEGRLTDGIYQLQPHHAYPATLTTSDVWHCRLGHPHQQVLQKISSTINIFAFLRLYISANPVRPQKAIS